MTTTTEQPPQQAFDQWALIEIMGHRKLAGRVTQETIAGHAMLRVDVPAVNGTSKWTTYLNASAIFSLTCVSEAVAKAQAEAMHARPVMVYRADQQRLLPSADGDDDWQDDDMTNDLDGR